MWNKKEETITRERHQLVREQDQLYRSQDIFDKDKEIAKLAAKLELKNEADVLRNEVKDLETQLKIERSNTALVKAEAKAQYAEHVMKVADDRVKELAEIYQNYAKNLTDVVKASHPQAVNNILKS